MPAKYSKELLEDHKYFELYSLLNDFFSHALKQYPAVAVQYGSNPDDWAMKFIHCNTREPLESLEYSEDDLNPKLIPMMQAYGTDEEFESAVLGEASHWLSDLFYKTEFGKTRLILEKAMYHANVEAEEKSEKLPFLRVPETSRWYLSEFPSTDSKMSEQALEPTARRHRDKIAWPPDQKYDDARQGRRARRPSIRRNDRLDFLRDVLTAAQGAVEMNVLTRLFVGLHPYLVRDGSDIIPAEVSDNYLENRAGGYGYESGAYDTDYYSDDYSTDERGGESW